MRVDSKGVSGIAKSLCRLGLRVLSVPIQTDRIWSILATEPLYLASRAFS